MIRTWISGTYQTISRLGMKPMGLWSLLWFLWKEKPLQILYGAPHPPQCLTPPLISHANKAQTLAQTHLGWLQLVYPCMIQFLVGRMGCYFAIHSKNGGDLLVSCYSKPMNPLPPQSTLFSFLSPFHDKFKRSYIFYIVLIIYHYFLVIKNLVYTHYVCIIWLNISITNWTT